MRSTTAFGNSSRCFNHDEQPVELAIRVDAGCDFADLFEVKDALAKKGTYSTRVEDGQLVLAYERDTYRRTTTVGTTEPAEVDEHGLQFTVRIDPHGSWSTELRVVPAMLGPGGRRLTPMAAADGRRREMAADLAGWVARAPTLTCDRDSLTTTYRRSLVDLAALRFAPATAGSRSLPAAGLPWFMRACRGS